MRLTTLSMMLCLGACGTGNGNGPGTADGGGDGGGGGGGDAPPAVPLYTELWYSVDTQLIRIVLDAGTGDVQEFVASPFTGFTPPLGQSLLTMLPDGSLLGGRQGPDQADMTHLFHIPSPPRDGSAATAVSLGTMPGGIKLEGLYTDCDGHIYGMDTGVDVGSSDGNRLLRFTGDPLAHNFTFTVVSDLATAVVADIDDMSPRIENNEIHDNPGLAIDTGHVYAFNFETGTGTEVGTGGTWGMHALGKQLFTDGVARLYVLSRDAVLYRMDPVTYAPSPSLGTGPTPANGAAGWSGLAGPLTECDSGFVIL